MNRNQGAESTLALLSTLQHARRSATGPVTTHAPGRTRPAQPRPTRRRPVPGHHPAVRTRARRASIIRSHEPGRCSPASWPWTTTTCSPTFDDVMDRFDGRHRDLDRTFRRHADELADRLDPDEELSEARRLLLGATFTSEYAIEGAALCNPSMVPHPDQTGLALGQPALRDERPGHRGRTPVLDRLPDGRDRCRGQRHGGSPQSVRHGRDPGPGDARRGHVPNASSGGSTAPVRPPTSSSTDSGTASPASSSTSSWRGCMPTSPPGGTAGRPSRCSAPSGSGPTGSEFADHIPLPERVLWPSMGAERAGMEDARFVRFVDDDGAVTYYATYTAYDGIPRQPAAARDQ